MAEFLDQDFTRSNSDASSLTAENSGIILHQLADKNTAWTNEKHNLYLNHLELSFVKRLQKSMGLLELVSRQNKSEKSVSQQLSTDVHISSDQGGHWKDINHARGHPLLYTSANSCDFLRCVGNQKSRESADMQEFLVPRSTEEHRAILTQRLSTWSHQLPASNLYTECMGQNFTDEGSQNDSNNEPRAKRMKAALTGDPGNDQIVPSGKYPVSDNRTIHG